MYPSAAPKTPIIERDLLEHTESAIMSQDQASNISALRGSAVWNECPRANRCMITITISLLHSQAMAARPRIWNKIRFVEWMSCPAAPNQAPTMAVEPAISVAMDAKPNAVRTQCPFHGGSPER